MPTIYVKTYVNRGRPDASMRKQTVRLKRAAQCASWRSGLKNSRAFTVRAILSHGKKTLLNRSSDGKESLGCISKIVSRQLRRLLVSGMAAQLRQMKVNPDHVAPWAMSLRERKYLRVVTAVMANKTAYIIRRC